MKIILSGGEHAGAELEWDKHGLLEDGREYVYVDEYIYVLVDEFQAVFYGMK